MSDDQILDAALAEPQPATPPAAARERLDALARETLHLVAAMLEEASSDGYNDAEAIIRRALDAAREDR